jgi:hypothetical protein
LHAIWYMAWHIWKVAPWYIPLFDGIYHTSNDIYHMVYTKYIPWYIALNRGI